MSTLKTGALRGTSGTADSIQLHASNQSVTFPGAVTITGALTSSTTALGGKIRKIVVNETNDYLTNPTDWSNFMSATITPTASDSKFVLFAQPSQLTVEGGSETQIRIKIGDEIFGYREHRAYQSTGERWSPTWFWVMEGSYSAGTAYTFYIQAKRTGGSGTVEMGNSSNADWKSSIMLIELEA